MKRRFFKGWIFYLALPVVGFLGLVGLWLAINSAIENYRLGTITDQMIAAVAVAREMRFAPSADPSRSALELMNRLSGYESLRVAVATPASAGSQEVRAMVNAWQELIRAYVYPVEQAVRFETKIPAPACRRLVTFYGKDALSLGLRRVDARDAEGPAIWRLVYDESTRNGQSGPQRAQILAGCGEAPWVLVSLTFRLR